MLNVREVWLSHLLVNYTADNFFKQFRPRSYKIELQARSGSKLFDTMIVFLKDFFEKVDFEKKNQQTTKRGGGGGGGQRVNDVISWTNVAFETQMHAHSALLDVFLGYSCEKKIIVCYV